MNPAAGPFAVASALLVLAGTAKAWRPADTANALRGVGLPGSRSLVRVGGALEAALGVIAIVNGGRAAALLVALSYTAFTVFVVRALALDRPLATCGCLGKADAPPSPVHVGVNVGAAAAAIAVAVSPGVGLTAVLDSQPLGGAPYLLLVATGVGLSAIAVTLVPRTLALVGERRAA